MFRLGFLLLLAPCIPAVTQHLTKTKVAEGITVSLPSGFYPMQPEDIAQRYPSVRKPVAAYTDADRLVDFTIATSATQWPDSNLEMAKEFFKSGVFNLYDRVELIDEGIHEVKKKEYIFFEFNSRINGDRNELGSEESILKYTYIQYLVEPRRTLVITFSCPERMQEEWKETAHRIMRSVTIN